VYANVFELGTCDFATREISTPKLFPNRTYGAGQPHVGLCPIFIVIILPQVVKIPEVKTKLNIKNYWNDQRSDVSLVLKLS